jgi:hypothetical protein
MSFSVSGTVRWLLSPILGSSNSRSTSGAGPVFAFVDNIGPTSDGRIDIDGDGTPDIAHGVVAAINLKSRMANARVLMVDSEASPAGSQNPQEVTRQGCQGRIRAFQQLTERLNRGERLDGVNFSCATAGTTLTELGEVIGMDLSPTVMAGLRGPQLQRTHEEIRQRLFRLADQADRVPMDDRTYRYAYYGKVLQSMEAVSRRGVPIYVAAGNEGPNHLNLYSLAQGAISVGAVNARGERTVYTADDSTNPFVTRYAQGDFNIRAIRQNGQVSGYDINGDGRVDVPAHLVSGRGRFVHPTLSQLNGRPLSEVLLRPTELAHLQSSGLNEHSIRMVPELDRRVMTVEQYGQLRGLDAQTVQRMKSQGDYTTWDGQWTFRLRQDGRLVYNPDGSALPADALVVGANRGTSFAAPTRMTSDAMA